MRGVNSFVLARYIIFGLFTICNAITCSVAVWNSTLARSTQILQVDIYLISLGALSLLSIFTLISVELLYVSALTTRVWFECAWIALFWVMELAGGAALIAIESDVSCSRKVTPFLDTLCASERVLLAFTWTCTIMLLAYLLALVFIVASQNLEVPGIWDSDVRALRIAPSWRCSSSTPNSPLVTGFRELASGDIYTPQLVHSQPVQPFHHCGSLSPEYETEPFRPVFLGPEQMDPPHPPSLPEAIPLPAAPITSQFMKPIPALPQNMGKMSSPSSSQSDMPQGLASSIVCSRPTGLPSRPVPSQSDPSPSPPPLGDWPRHNIMQMPVEPKFPKKHMARTDWVSLPTNTVTQPRPRWPSGP